MKLKMFTVYDSKAEAYLRPFFVPSTGEAVRAFEDNVNDPNSGFHKHPEDYTLFEIGDFDPTTAQCVMLKANISLGVAIQFLQNNKIDSNVVKM